MTWQVPWVTAGVSEIPLEIARTVAYVTTAGREGIVASSHLKVTQTSTASGSVLIAPGVFVTRNVFEGAGTESFESYVGRNHSTSETLAIPATGGASGRTDLVYAHITDPGQSGHFPKPEPTVSSPVQTRVIQNVSPTVTKLQDVPGYENQSGYALARITRPANSTTVLNSHITDLRHLLEEATGPIGQITMYGGTVAPYAWEICDGREVSRTTYSALFSAIGTNFGAGNTTTTFNLPDFRGRGPLGVGTGDAAQATAHPIAQKGGAERHQLTVPEMPSHSHTVQAAGGHNHTGVLYTSQNGEHFHYFQRGDGTGGAPNRVARGSSTAITEGNTENNGSHIHSVTIPTDGSHSHTLDNTGGGGYHNIMQPYLAVNFIIKAF